MKSCKNPRCPGGLRFAKDNIPCWASTSVLQKSIETIGDDATDNRATQNSTSLTYQLGDTKLTECVTSILEGALRMPTKLYAIVEKSEPVAESVKKLRIPKKKSPDRKGSWTPTSTGCKLSDSGLNFHSWSTMFLQPAELASTSELIKKSNVRMTFDILLRCENASIYILDDTKIFLQFLHQLLVSYPHVLEKYENTGNCSFGSSRHRQTEPRGRQKIICNMERWQLFQTTHPTRCPQNRSPTILFNAG